MTYYYSYDFMLFYFFLINGSSAKEAQKYTKNFEISMLTPFKEKILEYNWMNVILKGLIKEKKEYKIV